MVTTKIHTWWQRSGHTERERDRYTGADKKSPTHTTATNKETGTGPTKGTVMDKEVDTQKCASRNFPFGNPTTACQLHSALTEQNHDVKVPQHTNKGKDHLSDSTASRKKAPTRSNLLMNTTHGIWYRHACRHTVSV